MKKTLSEIMALRILAENAKNKKDYIYYSNLIIERLNKKEEKRK